MAGVVATIAREPKSLGGRIAKDMIISGIIVFLLGSQLIGIETIDDPKGLRFITRYDDVFVAALVVALGRAGMQMLRAGIAWPVLIGSVAFAVAVIGSTLIGGERDLSLLPFSNKIVDWIFGLTAVVFALRALVVQRRGGAPAPRGGGVMDAVSARTQKYSRYAAGLMILFAILLPVLFPERRIVDMGILVLTYCMLGWGLNVVVGLAGLLDLGFVAFYAVGAYSYALFAHYFDWSFWGCLPLAGAMAAFFGIVLGFPVLRLRGDYLAIVTLGFGEMIRVILINWWWFTGGPDGIRDIPRPSFLGLPFERQNPDGGETFHSVVGPMLQSVFDIELTFAPLHRIVYLYYIILILSMVTCVFTLRLRRLPIGRAWEALREDETACRALGINPRNTKLTAFSIGAMIGGFGGAFFATRQGFISPESFTFIESAVILAIVVLGGLGSQLGVVLASTILIGLPEVFRELADFRMIAFGAGMVLIMIWRPRGLLAHRDPTVLLHGKSALDRRDRAMAGEGSG
ncbi:MAG: high-affinity branched-chain amino acid ABC transporter permease LivM [Rhodospirillaceae bacterium]|nr:high-affinity branched-chain amino acid ABC transporter permease LivM [Rhodospirillaceae bacterium]